MNYRKAILGAAGVIALTAGVQQSANAANTPGDTPARLVAAAGTSQTINSDPLFDLIGRINGSFSGEAIESALLDMFVNPSQGEIESFPALLANISGLGVRSEALDRSRDALIEIALGASGIDADLRNIIVGRLESENAPIVLAQGRKQGGGLDEEKCWPGTRSSTVESSDSSTGDCGLRQHEPRGGATGGKYQ